MSKHKIKKPVEPGPVKKKIKRWKSDPFKKERFIAAIMINGVRVAVTPVFLVKEKDIVSVDLLTMGTKPNE